MHAVSLLLETFDLEAHIACMRSAYGRKKNLMLSTIRRTFPKDVSFTNPRGGMFTWLTFPEGLDSAQFMLEHALPHAKVAYVPGATFFPNEQRVNHARLSYSGPAHEVIVKGMTALGELLSRQLAQGAPLVAK
jgi:DNA-binding transcriptional MocR family regulator